MNKKDYKYKIYGRSKGRKKNVILDKNLIKNIFVKDINLIKEKHNILDIGSGSGENVLLLSQIYPRSQIIACEIFEDGNLNLCNKIILKKLKNILIYNGNVIELFDNLNKENFFDLIWILFPDPWPKKKHSKRRLLNNEFFKQISKNVKKNGEIHIATDSTTYFRQILSSIYDCKNYFSWENQSKIGWEYDTKILPETKFYKKAINYDRKPIYLKLRKI